MNTRTKICANPDCAQAGMAQPWQNFPRRVRNVGAQKVPEMCFDCNERYLNEIKRQELMDKMRAALESWPVQAYHRALMQPVMGRDAV